MFVKIFYLEMTIEKAHTQRHRNYYISFKEIILKINIFNVNVLFVREWNWNFNKQKKMCKTNFVKSRQ